MILIEGSFGIAHAVTSSKVDHGSGHPSSNPTCLAGVSWGMKEWNARTALNTVLGLLQGSNLRSTQTTTRKVPPINKHGSAPS